MGTAICDLVGIIVCYFSAAYLVMALFGQIDNLFLSIGTVAGGLYGSKKPKGSTKERSTRDIIVGCLSGGMLGNAGSDGIAGAFEASMAWSAVGGVTIGCLCILLFIPRIYRTMKYIEERKNKDKT